MEINKQGTCQGISNPRQRLRFHRSSDSDPDGQDKTSHRASKEAPQGLPYEKGTAETRRRRRKMLRYIKAKKPEVYLELINKLGLRVENTTNSTGSG